LDFDRFRDEDFLSSFVLELDLFFALDRDLERLKFSVFSLEFSKKEFSKGEFSIESLLWGVFYKEFARSPKGDVSVVFRWRVKAGSLGKSFSREFPVFSN